MTDTPAKNSVIQWQEGPEDGIGEPALLIEAHYGTITINQAGASILINSESIDELIKNLRYFQKLEKEQKLK